MYTYSYTYSFLLLLLNSLDACSKESEQTMYKLYSSSFEKGHDKMCVHLQFCHFVACGVARGILLRGSCKMYVLMFHIFAHVPKI